MIVLFIPSILSLVSFIKLNKVIPWLFIFIVVFLYAFRYDYGGDWDSYLFRYDNLSSNPMLGEDLGYFYLQRLFQLNNLSFSVLVFSITIFEAFSILFTTSKVQRKALLLLFLSVYFIPVVCVGYIRQGLSICIAFLAFSNKRVVLRYSIYIIAFTFHSSAIVSVLLLELMRSENERLWRRALLLTILIAFVWITYQLTMDIYGSKYEGIGIYHRMLIYAIPLLKREVWRTNYVAVFVLLLLAIWVGINTTVLDRMFLPLTFIGGYLLANSKRSGLADNLIVMLAVMSIVIWTITSANAIEWTDYNFLWQYS